MLESLYIRNLALVTELELEFSRGLNTVTGETGAGKSLILGAIQLLAGGRATSGMIRKGSRSCEITGTFHLTEEYPALRDWCEKYLAEAGLEPMEDNKLLIRRVISDSGSRAFVNGSQTTAAILKDLGERLVDIHGPAETQTLLHNARQLELLDGYAGDQAELQACSGTWRELQQVRRQLQELRSETLNPEDIELLKYQLKEIDDAELQENEEEELVARHKILSHARHLLETAQVVCNGLQDGEDSVVEKMAAVLRTLREIEQLDQEKGGEFSERLELLEENVADLSRDIADYAGSLDIDEEALSQVEERLELVQRLKRKYGPTLKDVLETGERLRRRLEAFGNRQGEMSAAEQRERELQAAYRETSRKLSQKRKKAAGKLAAEICVKLNVLGFKQARLEVNVTEAAQPGATGQDHCEFCFAPNPGEDIHPLKQIASSGEIARVMLAIKTVLSEVDGVPVLVFDEIDANIGGLVASAVAGQLRDVGRRHQLFCITHLPVIAAAGNQHFLVAKEVLDGRTNTSMRLLEGEDRTSEITRMMGAQSDDAVARKHASALLKQQKG